ncbi:unnamed protein product [Lasius platythorax]|uniref:Uncharacterized protein n=1 Tax=Lasius platythorax TaxID=488582 RepID=A0AAV2NX27_9HYME
MNSAIFRLTDNRTYIYVQHQEGWMASPVVDIDVDWPEGCGSWPSKQSNLSADPTCGSVVRISRRGEHVAVLVTNRRATVSQVRRFHFVSPDSRTGLPQLFPDRGNFVGSISCSRRSGNGDK